MLASPLFTGCATALITPFLPDQSLDLSALCRLIDIQINAGIDAIVLLGTTGEPCTLTMDEREAVIHAGVTAAKGRIPVIVGTGSNDTRRAIDYALQAKRLSAAGQLCVTPYYNKTTQAGLIRHYNAIMDASDLPTILYNVPSRTGMTIAPETAAALASHPHAAGLKEASGSIELITDILHATGGQLPIYSGNDDTIVPMMSMGAAGVISVCSNILPMQTRAIAHASLYGCYAEARKTQMLLLPLIRLLFSQVSPIPLKAALSMMGIIHDVLRPPLTTMEGTDRIKLREKLQEMKLIS